MTAADQPIPPVVVHLDRPRRWQWWREVVLLLLAFTVLALVLQARADRAQIGALTERLDATSAQASTERAELEDRLIALQANITDQQTVIAAKDREIARLNAVILAAGLDPGRRVDTNGDGDRDLGSSGSEPQPTPTQAPSPTPRPSPSPSPSASPSPTPTPSPEPSCLIPNPFGGCILPRPAARTGPPFRTR